MQVKEERAELIRILVQLVVGLVIFFVIRSIVVTLPMERNLGYLLPPFYTSLYPAGLAWTQLFDIILLTILIFFLLHFGGRLQEQLPYAFPGASKLGRMAYLTAVLIAILIGYFAYDDLIVPPLGKAAWVYALAFWLPAIGTLAGLGWLAYQHSGQILNLIQALRARKAMTTSPPEARSEITPSQPAKPRKRKIKAVKAPAIPGEEARVCAQCGASLKPDDAFCGQCGARVGGA